MSRTRDTLHGRVRARALAGMGTVLLSCAPVAPALAAPAWDIVGIRLGMTEPQARAALKAHHAQAEVDERTLQFTFNDGAKQQSTPAFLATLQARIPGPPGSSDGENIKIEFSAPPREPRVIGVRREVTTYASPPPLDRMRASLTQKYGAPAATSTHGMGVRNEVLEYAEAGKPVCGQQAGRAMVFTPASQSPRDLRLYRQWQQQKLAPADLSTCSARLRADMGYREGGASVNTLVIEMNDVGGMLPALVATEQWLTELEAAARKARLDSGTTPKL